MADEEQLECFGDDDQPMGLVARSEAHRRGFWHRTVNVFLVAPDGRLCLQQRSDAKDVCPLCWDLSAAEHLHPGESYSDGAVRGVAEELGIRLDGLAELGGPTRTTLHFPALNVLDREIHYCYRAVGSAALQTDPAEVAAIKWLHREALEQWIAERPGEFTPWFLEAYQSYGERVWTTP